MDVTKESQSQTLVRLRSVLRAAEIEWLPGVYAFTETSDPSTAALALTKALAIVRDKDTWSVLGEAVEGSREVFRVFACHFDATLPNSGFVGWLASEIKREVGSGVFVVCGQNQNRGGIFDYWGLPAEVAEDAKAFLNRLKEHAEPERDVNHQQGG